MRLAALKYKPDAYKYSWSEIFIVVAVFTKELGSRNDFGIDFDYLGYPFFILYFFFHIAKIFRENSAPKGMFLYLIASSVISIVSLNIPPDGFLKQIIPIIIILSVTFTVLTKSNIHKIFLLYVNITFITAILGIIQVILSFNGIQVMIKEPGRLDSIAYEPSHYASLLMPALVYTYLNIRKHLVYFIVMLTALILTFNLTCYIVFLAIFTFATFHPIYVLITVPLAYYLSFSVLPNISSNFNHRFNDTYSTLTGKREILGVNTYVNTTTLSFFSNYETAKYSLARNPFTGSGLGGHEEMYYRRFNGTAFQYNFNFGVNAKSAHSLSLRILSELGLIGMFFYLYLLIKNLVLVRKGLYYAISLSCISHFLCKTFKLGGYIDYGTPFFFTILILNARAFLAAYPKNSISERPENRTVPVQQTPEYVYSCLQYFTGHYDYDVTVIRYKDDANTRYKFAPSEKIHLLYKDDINITELVSGLDVAMIVVSSWHDKTYKKVAAAYKNSIPVVIGIDNPYTGASRQRLLAALSPVFIHRFFNRAWVAGRSQYEYARQLGFAARNIVTDVYSADTRQFYAVRDVSVEKKKASYPRTIVFVGRMVEYKRPQLLARLFNEVNQSLPVKWELLLAGEGPLKTQILQQNYPGVKVMDFISPAELPAFYQKAGIFCLPSTGEHWGVAVHEAAAAGMPLLLSDAVESRSLFLINGFNGHTFNTGDETSFKTALRQMMTANEQELLAMGENSYELSKRISHATWSASLNSMNS